jgi:hypothetical protein
MHGRVTEIALGLQRVAVLDINHEGATGTRVGIPIPDLFFSIRRFGIETFVIPGSRQDYVTTIVPLPHISHRPQFRHKSGHGLVRTWYCSIVDAKQVKTTFKNCNCRLHCNFRPNFKSLVSTQCTYK